MKKLMNYLRVYNPHTKYGDLEFYTNITDTVK